MKSRLVSKDSLLDGTLTGLNSARKQQIMNEDEPQVLRSDLTFLLHDICGLHHLTKDVFVYKCRASAAMHATSGAMSLTFQGFDHQCRGALSVLLWHGRNDPFDGPLFRIEPVKHLGCLEVEIHYVD